MYRNPDNRTGCKPRWAHRLGSFSARAFLRLCRATDAEEALRDLHEQAAARRQRGQSAARVALHSARELVFIGAYELRDRRMGKRNRQIFPWLALRLAARNLRRRPAVPALAALTLGVGYGAAAAIFGVYSGFGRPLPVPQGDAVHWVRVLDERGRQVALTRADLDVLADGSRSFADLGAFESASVTLRVPAGFPIRLTAARLSPELVELLRVEPYIGRMPATGADADGIMLSHAVWSEYFRADADVLGGFVRVDGVERAVAAIMPAGHHFPFRHDVWSIARQGAGTDRVELVGRLTTGVNATQAASDIERILEGHRAVAGGQTPDLRVQLPRFTEKRGEGGEHVALATLLALVVALVLVSCSNVSNLLLGRALVRADLLAVHAAIGAGPAQVIVQMFFEALLIAAAGAALGVAIAAQAMRYIETSLGGNWGFYWMRVQFEPSVVVFTIALAMATGLLSGMVPAIRIGRASLGDVLRADSVSVVGVQRGGLSRWLLNGQVTFSCLALIIAILMTGALLGSRTAPGFRAADVYAFGLTLEDERYADPQSRRLLRDTFLAQAAADDDLGVVAAANVLPGLENVGEVPEIDGVVLDPDDRRFLARVLLVTPTYFELFGMTSLAGETLADRGPDARTVAVVSSAFVREFLGAGDAVGRRLRLPQTVGPEWLTIIGVVADVAARDSADSRDRGRIYVPITASEPSEYQLLFTGPSAAVAGNAARRSMASIDADLALSGPFGRQSASSLEDFLRYLGQFYETAGVLALLGGVGAALVALIGLYGALSFEIQRRLTEIGVRMALGAARRDILRHVALTGLRSVAPGLALGFVMSAGFSPLLGVMLGRLSAREPLIYVGVFLAYLAVAVSATLLPGCRAARLDPVRVLRAD